MGEKSEGIRAFRGARNCFLVERVGKRDGGGRGDTRAGSGWVIFCSAMR